VWEPPNLYSGTFERFAASFPDKFQRSSQVTLHITHKNSKEPLGKGLKAHSTAFSMQHLGLFNVNFPLKQSLRERTLKGCSI
jgi:hypothetical protein